MKRDKRLKLKGDYKIVEVVLQGNPLEIVANKKATHLKEKKKTLSWERAIIKLIEGK